MNFSFIISEFSYIRFLDVYVGLAREKIPWLYTSFLLFKFSFIRVFYNRFVLHNLTD
jgi:hypothetical protein